MSEQTVVNDPWDEANNAKPRDYAYFGLCVLDPWFAFFPGGGQKPIPFDPNQHPAEKRSTIIEAQIIPIPEQDVKFDVKTSFSSFSADWTRITLPSIKALGVDSIRDINNKYVRMSMVEGKREKKDDTGAKTGEYYKTWKFEELFADEAACRAAYGTVAPAHTEPQPPEQAPLNGDSPEKATALKFAEVVVKTACSGKGAADMAAVQDEVKTKFAAMPMINKHYTDQSPEIMQMIMTELSK